MLMVKLLMREMVIFLRNISFSNAIKQFSLFSSNLYFYIVANEMSSSQLLKSNDPFISTKLFYKFTFDEKILIQQKK